MKQFALNLLLLKEAREITDLDSPGATAVHREIIRNKASLEAIYRDFYDLLGEVVARVPEGALVEIGSGAGFLKQLYPHAVTSDVCYFPWVDLAFDAMAMPFAEDSLGVIYMQGVLHHLHRPAAFFTEAERCLKVGGRVLMIEPHNTPWARFVLKNFHHEPFDPEGGWELSQGGRLSHANQALPWIIFFRDRTRFQSDFPGLRIRSLRPYGPFQYLASGGLSFKQFVPTPLWGMVRLAEKLCTPFLDTLGYFCLIELEKVRCD